MDKCIITLESVTSVMRARKLLSAFAIGSQVVDTGGGDRRRGCAYGLSLDCRQADAADGVLGRYGIRHGIRRERERPERM